MIGAAGPSPGRGVPRPGAAGKFLFVGDRKLYVRGVAYGTFRPGEGGIPYPKREVVLADFSRIAACGFNAVRTYTVPPGWLLDAAEAAGLWVMVGLPWEQHVAFLDERGRDRSIEARVRWGVAACAGHSAVLCYAVGNEIPPSIVRWTGRGRIERHVRRLYDAAKEEDPGGLVTYVNFPSTEYLDLPFLDLVAFNVYLESTARLDAYIARLHNIAGDQPLLMTELGLDSRRNGSDAQARVVASQLRASLAGGCAGAFVFSWTDEWYRGGHEVREWDFGLTTRDRRPKRALGAVREALADPVPLPAGGRPRISVVVCMYNGERTVGDCLEGLSRLEYPDYEVIVVDDGSTDASAEIASRYGFRLIRTRNRGLGRARNTGIAAATGEIVAFIDGDARPDPDWLTYLALAFADSEYVGIGGPNIAPHGDSQVAACVANAPGGPIHVLLTDREAEHIPGCNMAFRKEALEAVGGFDPRFRVAGDDVDLCWRLQARGWKIGFAPAALVWHHARDSVGAYWRQQRGYGAAEALLEAKWPEKYNAAGHVTWGGRVYGPGLLGLPGRRGRVYQGVWGRAPFQQWRPAPPGLLWEATAMPEWYLALLFLAALSVLGIFWAPLLAAVPLLALGTGATLARAAAGGLRARLPGAAGSLRRRLRLRALIALLHAIQPAARLRGRLLHGLVPWRLRGRGRSFAWPRPRVLVLWRDRGEDPERTLAGTERHVFAAGGVVLRGGAYDDWDLEVRGGAFGLLRIRSCVEEHGEGRQLLRIALLPCSSAVGLALTGGPALLAPWALAGGSAMVAAVLAGAAAGAAILTCRQCGTSMAAALAAVEAVREETTERRSAPRTGEGESPDAELRPRRPAAFQAG